MRFYTFPMCLMVSAFVLTLLIVGCERQQNDTSKSREYPVSDSNPLSLPCVNEVEVAKSQLERAIQQVQAALQTETDNYLVPVAPGIPTLVDLSQAIGYAEQTANNYQCTQAATSASLNLYIQQARQVYNIGSQALENKIRFIEKLAEQGRISEDVYSP